MMTATVSDDYDVTVKVQRVRGGGTRILGPLPWGAAQQVVRNSLAAGAFSTEIVLVPKDPNKGWEFLTAH